MVTDTIIEHLEGHLEDWKRPWIAFGKDDDYARNPSRKDAYYRGVNQFLLSMLMLKGDFFRNQWMTFKQAKQMGGNVRKGEKSVPVIFYSTKYIDEKNKYYSKERYKALSPTQAAELGVQPIPVLKLYRVFNVAQIEGLDAQYYEVEPQEPLQDFQKDERAEALIRLTGADIDIVQSNRAYYNRIEDRIQVPLREQFRSETENWYATTLHELGHWTGHESRLNREFGKTFGDKKYGQEELVSELCSAYICAALGFSKTITNNAAYIQSWLGVLKEDNKAIIRAAAAAQKAADYLLEGTPYAIVAPTEPSNS